MQVQLRSLFERVRRPDGQGLVEYALILALIAVIVIVALQFIGGAVSTELTTIGNSV